MRKTFVLLVAFAACVLAAAPALAKGPGMEITSSSATIEGHGLPAPIHLTSGRDCGVAYPCYDFADLDDPLVNLATLTGVAFGPPSYARPTDVPQTGSAPLGARYEITYTVTFADGVTRSVVQDVYPWAGAHGWIYTAKDQNIFDRDVAAGWTPAPTTLRAALIDLGIPSTPPALGAPVTDAPAAGSPGTVIFLASLLLLALLAGGVLTARSRRTAPPVTAG
jgi:hypothetical protein